MPPASPIHVWMRLDAPRQGQKQEHWFLAGTFLEQPSFRITLAADQGNEQPSNRCCLHPIPSQHYNPD